LIQRSAEIYGVVKIKLPSITSGIHNEAEAPIWRHFVESYFLPLNAQMAELIRSKIYLVEEDELPDSWKLFLEHQTQYEILHNLWKEKNVSSDEIKGKRWPSHFEDDVKNRLSLLRGEYNTYARRLKLTANISHPHLSST
jgi:hypothetical protein